MTKLGLALPIPALLAALPFVGAAEPAERKTLGEIEFFGYQGLDLDAVRAALPLHEGQPFAPEDSAGDPRAPLADAVQRAIGRPATDVEFVCCDDRQRWMIYIGLPGRSYRPAAYRPSPQGAVRLPPAVMTLAEQVDDALMAAVMKGDAGEDDARGFALSANAEARALQTKLRAYALENEAVLLRVVGQSSQAHHRAVAAHALGYARASARQASALARAALDPEAEVRNDATRALGVLLGARPDLARSVRARDLMVLLTSGVWRDRNKGGLLFDGLTRGRDRAVLDALRAQALPGLIEMARWRSPGHAFSARVILGRVAGIEEERLLAWVGEGRVDEILAAVSAARP